MSYQAINSVSKKRYKRLFDKIGALEKGIKMRRMEPYAEIIGRELEKYNQDDNFRTMMIKLLRNPVEGTTTRRKHTENVAEIAGEIANNFDWLNTGLTKVMARHHDTGHTFLGHSGEWWLSSIKDTYAMGNYVHNALGARKLIYREDIFSDIEKAIKKSEPNIRSRKLAAIKRDLWLIVDGINCHNGEKSEFSYAPDFSKRKKRFFDEVMGCFVKKGYDRTLEPATAEGSLMRLCDKISYIPFDLVDIFRNGCNIETYNINGKVHNFYEEYRQKFRELGMPEDSLEKLLECKTEEDYDSFAYNMQKILVADVVKNSRRNNIRMSPAMSKTMHGIRDINNSLMVNYIVLKEDHEVYPAAMETLMHRYAKVLLENGLIDSKNVENSYITELPKEGIRKAQLMEAYWHMPDVKRFISYISGTSARDFEFTVDMVKKAFEETIDSELDVAKSIASGTVDGVTVEAKGDRKERLTAYVNAFNESLDVAYNEGIVDTVSKGRINSFKRNVWLDKTKKKLKAEILKVDKTKPISAGSTSLAERVALEMSAQFLSSLNDKEWKRLLLDSKIVSEEQMKSLTRGYSTFDFRGESQKHKDWDNISKLQARATESISSDITKENFLTRAKRFLGIERER